MEINTEKLQQQPAAVMPVKTDSVGQPVASAVDATAAINSGDLKQAVSQLNEHVQNIQRDLQFSIDIESGVIVVKVIDVKSEKVIRQMPTEEILKLAQDIVKENDHTALNFFSSRA